MTRFYHFKSKCQVFNHKKSPLAGSGELSYNNNYYIGLYMSNENRLGAETPSPDTDTTLNGISIQEGNL